VLLGHAAIFGHQQNNVLQDSPRARYPCGEAGYGREVPKILLHACWEGKASEEIRNFLWGGGTFGGSTRSGVVGVAAAVLTIAAAFFLDFPAAALVAVVGLGLVFLGLAFFLVAVTLGCSCPSVTF
jgi:hypothetical protein